MGRSLYGVVDTTIGVLCLPVCAALVLLIGSHNWAVPRLRRVRPGMVVTHWPAMDQREDLLVVDVSQLATGRVGVRRRTWNVLGHSRRNEPPPPYGGAVEFWTAAEFWLGRRSPPARRFSR